MATPQQRFEAVCDQIYDHAIENCPMLDIKAISSFIDAAFKQAKTENPFMSDYTISDYFHHITAKRARKELEIWQQPIPAPTEFWDAAFEYDPLRQESEMGSNRLGELTHPSRFGVISLGRVYDDVELGVKPELGALPESTIAVDDFTTLPFARGISAAISYSDQHPSHESAYQRSLKPVYDQQLRRFVSLGWVFRKFDDGMWEMTGHVLVMDMDRGRDRHPWIVLAHEWPNNDNEGPHGDFKVHAPRRVRRNARDTPGVFPGDDNRTSIAKIIPMNSVEGDDRPILKRFDPDLEFRLLRESGDRESIRTEWGPDLAHVMDWYWNEKAKEEVCYSRDGSVYMRYDPERGEYRYPHLNDWSTDSELGLYGELRAPPLANPQNTGKVLPDSGTVQEVIPKDRQDISSSGF